MLEKQRQTEQDRGLLLTAIEAERGKLIAMRAERIKLGEERNCLEKELTELAQERWLTENQTGIERNRVSGPGVPYTGQSRPSAPDVQQRQRGIRQDEQPPAVVGGGFLEERYGAGFASN